MSPRKNPFEAIYEADIASAPLLGVEMIVRERNRQIVTERWSSQHDDTHTDDSLAIVAAMYAVADVDNVSVMRHTDINDREDQRKYFDAWPATWAATFDKRAEHPRLRQLAIAGALIAAEIDRLQRHAIRHDEDSREFVPLPCPFCGTQPEGMTPSAGEPAWTVHCANTACEIQPTISGADKATAIGRWNRRPE